jgi:hypothetical protein
MVYHVTRVGIFLVVTNAHTCLSCVPLVTSTAGEVCLSPWKYDWVKIFGNDSNKSKLICIPSGIWRLVDGGNELLRILRNSVPFISQEILIFVSTPVRTSFTPNKIIFTEINNRLNCRNTCHQSIQNLLISLLLSENRDKTSYMKV